jgi:hypothetical protein
VIGEVEALLDAIRLESGPKRASRTSRAPSVNRGRGRHALKTLLMTHT